MNAHMWQCRMGQRPKVYRMRYNRVEVTDKSAAVLYVQKEPTVRAFH